MNTRHLLRLEGLAVFAAAVTAFVLTGRPWWLLGALALAPDVGMLGYVVGPRVGAVTYNALHLYVGPLALGVAGLWLSVPAAVSVALVWTAHIGADRALGYGLKRASAFRDTHLSAPADRRKRRALGTDPEPVR